MAPDGFLTSPAVLTGASERAQAAAQTARGAQVPPVFTGAVAAVPGATATTAIRDAGARLDGQIIGWAHQVDAYAANLSGSGTAYTTSDTTNRSRLLTGPTPATPAPPATPGPGADMGGGPVR